MCARPFHLHCGTSLDACSPRSCKACAFCPRDEALDGEHNRGARPKAPLQSSHFVSSPRETGTSEWNACRLLDENARLVSRPCCHELLRCPDARCHPFPFRNFCRQSFRARCASGEASRTCPHSLCSACPRKCYRSLAHCNCPHHADLPPEHVHVGGLLVRHPLISLCYAQLQKGTAEQ